MAGDREGDGRQGEADENLPQRREPDDAVHRRVDDRAEQRDEGQHEQRVDRLDLAGEPFPAEEVAVHPFGLLHPGAAGLIEERPEHGHEQVQRQQLADRRQALGSERLREVPRPAGRHVHEAVPTEPEDERRQGHEDSRNAERPAGAVVLQQPGGEQRGEEGAEVDGEVEPAEHLLQEMAVRLAELVAHVGRDAGLDAPRADGDQCQAGQQPAPRLHRRGQKRRRGVHQRQAQVPDAIHQREQEDRQVLAEERVGHDAADDRKEVGAGDEQMEPFPGLGLGHEVRPGGRREQVLRHEDDEDRLHAVERKPLGGLVAHDEGNAGGHGRGGGGTGAVGDGSHGAVILRQRCGGDGRDSMADRAS